jgi:hypothetical protein
MKRSKPSSFRSSTSPPEPRKVRSRADLLDLQRAMAGAILRPLDARWRMQRRLEDGRNLRAEASEFIKPNDRLSSFERLEIYNRQYWFRLLDCLYDDYPGLLAVLGQRKFLKFATAYLERYPSDSFALRDLGARLEQFLREEPQWSAPREALALDMVRFEWAQVVAFDGLSKPPITPDEILDTPPGKLRLELQPYLSILALRYAVDDFLIALKRRSTDGLRGEASNAVESAPKASGRKKPVRLPARMDVDLAVHRHDNRLYFKRLEPEAFAILSALSRGATLEDACVEAIASSKRGDVDWTARIKEWFQNWAALGWLCRAK